MNTAPMSHAGNWARNPRKLALERHRAAERERKEREAQGELRPVTLYAHYVQGGRRPNWFRLHPCATFGICHFKVGAVCISCAQSWALEPFMLDDTPWAHRFWPEVLGELFCPACGGHAAEVRFSDREGEVGALSIHPKVTLQVFKSVGFTRPEPSRGAIDPFAQHDDGPGS